MTLLDDAFMIQEMDYPIVEENRVALYNDYYYEICGFIRKCNAYRLTPEEIEYWLDTGLCKKSCDYVCGVKNADERKRLFKRAMATQLIYDAGSGRNSMIRGTEPAEDLCRSAKNILEIIGLLQHFGW